MSDIYRFASMAYYSVDECEDFLSTMELSSRIAGCASAAIGIFSIAFWRIPAVGPLITATGMFMAGASAVIAVDINSAHRNLRKYFGSLGSLADKFLKNDECAMDKMIKVAVKDTLVLSSLYTLIRKLQK